jgi:hypothetical protein
MTEKEKPTPEELIDSCWQYIRGQEREIIVLRSVTSVLKEHNVSDGALKAIAKMRKECRDQINITHELIEDYHAEIRKKKIEKE